MKESMKKANFRRNTISGGDSCLFCEYRRLSQDKQRVTCRLHNVVLGEGENFGSGEYVCDCFQESEWFGSSVNMLLDDSRKNKSSDTKKHQRNSVATNQEGCYIATAVYGGYDKPEVLVLRKYRDNVLKHSWFGRLFIKIYYSISPFLAKKLKHNSLLNKEVKKLLDIIVCKVNSNIYEPQ